MFSKSSNSAWRRFIGISISLLAAQQSESSALGIGFSLTLNYGTATLDLGREQFIDIARIEGSQSYKDMMRSLDIRSPIASDFARSPRLPYILDEYCQPLPDSSVCKTRDQALENMLRLLGTAVVSFLEHDIATVVITFPFPISDSLRQSLRSIEHFVPFEIRLSSPAGSLVAKYRDKLDCRTMYSEHDGGELILTIDYSQAALTAMVISGMCHQYVQRIVHEPNFGAEAMNNDPDLHIALQSTLHQLSVVPVQCRLCQRTFNHVDKVFLLGDAVNDPQLREVLKRTLHKELYTKTFDTGYKILEYQVPGFEDPILHPAFEASTYAAQDCWYFEGERTIRPYLSCWY